MIASSYRRDQLVIAAAMSLLVAGCTAPGINAPLSALQGAPGAQRAIDSGYTSIYSFKGGSDGAQPVSSLLDVNGKLYGTTLLGGDIKCAAGGGDGCGTVFEATDSGTARVLHRFAGAQNDGSFPHAGLTAVNGKLYGTTGSGGSNYVDGTVFEITSAGKERIVRSFTGTDGDFPTGDLIDVNGKLYGTTEYGTNHYGCYSGEGCGDVFEVDHSGSERVLYNFKGQPENDGAEPEAGLTSVSGLLYGTTAHGGVHDYTGGIVFSVTSSGKEHILHAFRGGHDGTLPYGKLTLLNGNVYGTTLNGGAYGFGTVFEIKPSGTEKVIYAFKGPPTDGFQPYGTLAVIGDNLYGITSLGGSGKCAASGSGCGTIFEVSPSGKERVLYSFKAGKDGALPSGGLIAADGVLFGTTYAGGTGKCSASISNSVGGCGTIFRMTP
jgi:uncharacterized repeat protein (TIGR03803 family)